MRRTAKLQYSFFGGNNEYWKTVESKGDKQPVPSTKTFLLVNQIFPQQKKKTGQTVTL